MNCWLTIHFVVLTVLLDVFKHFSTGLIQNLLIQQSGCEHLRTETLHVVWLLIPSLNYAEVWV